MVKRKSSSGKKNPRKSKSVKSLVNLSIGGRINYSWNRFTLFIILFAVSFIFYGLSSNILLGNFFGVLSVVLGVLAFAFLISFIVLSIARKK